METTSLKTKSVLTKLPKPNNIINVPTTFDEDFFTWWCIFLRPFLKLSNRELKVVTSLLKHRWLLSKTVSDPALLDEVVMNRSVRDKVIDECNITVAHYYVIMSNLRKNGVVVNNALNPKLIPNMRQDDNGNFQLLVLFRDTHKSA